MNRQILAMLENYLFSPSTDAPMQRIAVKNLGATGFCGATKLGAIVPNMGALMFNPRAEVVEGGQECPPHQWHLGCFGVGRGVGGRARGFGGS
jgi:hypothetical protein